jgi:hypothetical protein
MRGLACRSVRRSRDSDVTGRRTALEDFKAGHCWREPPLHSVNRYSRVYFFSFFFCDRQLILSLSLDVLTAICLDPTTYYCELFQALYVYLTVIMPDFIRPKPNNLWFLFSPPVLCDTSILVGRKCVCVCLCVLCNIIQCIDCWLSTVCGILLAQNYTSVSVSCLVASRSFMSDFVMKKWHMSQLFS